MKTPAAVAYPDIDGFVLETVEIEDPRSDEVMVEIAAVGLCHTDLVFKTGAGNYPLPAVLGHEGAGTVVKVGSAVTKVSIGDRVAMTFRSCGHCDHCVEGQPAYCRTMPVLNYAGRRIDGTSALKTEEGTVSSNFFGQSSFAGHALCYERNLIPIPDDFPFALAAPLGCGIQTGVGGITRALHPPAGSAILITGGGSVGLSAVAGAVISGCAQIILVEPFEARRSLGSDLGATITIDPISVQDLSREVRAHAPMGVDFAFDTTGVPAVQQSCLQCLGAKGVFGFVGVAPPGTPVPGEANTIMTLGQTIRGIIEGDSDPDAFIPELIDHYYSGRLPIDRLVKTYPFDEINMAIADQHNGKCVKPVLTFNHNN